jgi:hypothetical protein
LIGVAISEQREEPTMRLAVARLCLDCEEVHDGDRCPVCGSQTFAFLKKWVLPTALSEGSLRLQKDVRSSASPKQLKTYQQLLEPDRPASRKRSLIARGALGLAILGAVRLVWHLGKSSRDDA